MTTAGSGIGLLGDGFEVRGPRLSEAVSGPVDFVVLRHSVPVIISDRFDRSLFHKARVVTVDKTITGFLQDLQKPVTFKIVATYRKDLDGSLHLSDEAIRAR